ncbi:MAG: hypothetical protein IJ231_10820 [Clostridia bacterium]|nr:hypothetical protein [Clostridia bacterium]
MNKTMIRPAVKRALCVLLLLFSLILTFRTAWIVSTTLMDSDTSSELILGEKLAREGGIMSTSWVYSTELQVIDCQIIYSLLFRVCSDWSLVRFWGSVLMDLMMLGTFAYLARQARIPFNRFCLGGAALMLPFSIPYGRIILFHNYYSFQVSFSFLIVGLYLGAVRRAGNGGWKRWPFWTVSACLALTAFATGLGGIRHLMICVVPLVVTAALHAVFSEKKEENRLTAELPGLLLALVPLVFAGAGYLINLHVLANQYAYTDFSVQTISMGTFADLRTVLYSTFVDLGFQDYQTLFSMPGLLGICGVAAWIVSLFLAVHTIRHGAEPMARFLQLFWLMVQLIMTCVFIFLSGAELLHLLYLLPIVVWIIPALASADARPAYGVAPAAEKPFRREKKKGAPGRLLSGDAPLSAHGLLGILASLLLVANGLFYTGFFQNPKSLPVEYTGLQYNDTATVQGLQPVADYLRENGFTLMYGSYWDAAVVTELSDGAVKSVPVETGTHKHPIKYMKWLSDMNLRDPAYAAQQKVALLANMELGYAIEGFDELGAVEVTSIGGYTIFELTNPGALAEDLA